MDRLDGFNYLVEPLRRIISQYGIEEPTPPQLEASPYIANGENVLLIAPTGSGKTEAAILPVLSRLMGLRLGEGILVLYITPLRALNRDMLRRLNKFCTELGFSVDVRHGDTPQRARREQSKKPPHILVTTPETLQAILPGKRMRRNLRNLKVVIVDELHTLVESKRGVQLCIGLQRLRRIAGDFQLIALSATIGSPEIAAKFIFGNIEHRIIETKINKEFEYKVEFPTTEALNKDIIRQTFAHPDLAARIARLNELIALHSSSLIFVNSRTMAELIGEKLCRIREDVAVHHASLPRDERERVENSFKAGKMRALICTSTLELGIDIGSIDLVLQYNSPRQVTALIQRIGRSGHRLNKKSRGLIIAVSADDILESLACIELAKEGRIERLEPYQNSLDVLAHQIAGYVMDLGSIDCDELIGEIRNLYPYHTISEESFWKVVNYLASNGKVRVEGKRISASSRTREYYFENLSMIPDEIRYLVVDLSTNQTVGILGEEFVLLRARVGVHFICKGKVWQIEKISDDRKIYVTPVDDPLAAIPGWDGEMLPIPFELARKVGEMRRSIYELIENLNESDVVNLIFNKGDADYASIVSIVNQIKEQRDMGLPIPSDELILLEGYMKYLIVHMCFGEAVNRTFAYVFEELLSRKGLVRAWWMDGYRILFELTQDSSEIDMDELARELFFISPIEFERTYIIAIKRNFPFPGRVKVIAERFGALKRGKYISHPNLCSLPTRFESTPIFDEALQESERDLIDMKRAKEILQSISAGEIKVKVCKMKDRPTPIAYSMLYRYMEFPELIAPDYLGKSLAQRVKAAIMATSVELVCMKCGSTNSRVLINDLPDEIKCDNCSSGLLFPNYYNSEMIVEIIRKKISNQNLCNEERVELSKARRAADLVLSYGKRAIIALSVYGIGPQTASRILSDMSEDEEQFYKSLMEAKLRFITTRQYWSVKSDNKG